VSYYGVKAIRVDASRQRITHLLWERLGSRRPVNYHPTEVADAAAVEAINAGHHVHLLREVAHGEYWFGAEFHVVVYPDGTRGIDINGYELSELPHF